MCTSEPWITLGRSFETSLAIVRDPTREVYLARDDDRRGRVSHSLHDRRVRGLHPDHLHRSALPGTRPGFETRCSSPKQRILRVSPNIFMCVSSFNEGARRLYERLGYTVVGELTDYIVQGQSEILLRKTRGTAGRSFSAAR